MITELLVIQKIEEDGDINVHQIQSNNFQWTFETDRDFQKEDKEYFPFITTGKIKVLKRKPGRETKIEILDDSIKFIDDYGVPSGTVISILSPKDYIPDIIKFKENPYIPIGIVGQITTKPPGQIQVIYNKYSKQSAIILHIHERQLFGIKCLFKKVDDDEFPDNKDYWSDDLFDISISRNFLNIDSIKTEDLKIFNETMNIADLTDIQNQLNEILTSLKNNDKENVQSNLKKFGKTLMTFSEVTEKTENVLKALSDDGLINEFIKQIIKYVNI